MAEPPNRVGGVDRLSGANSVVTHLRQFVPPVVLAAGYAGLVAAVVAHWRADVSAVDRYLVLAGAVLAAVMRWRQVNTIAPRPFLGSVLASLGAILCPLAWAGYFVLFNARSVPFWVLWVALTLATAGWLFAAFGRRAVVKLLFPLVFVAFALPPPESLLRLVQHRLQAITTEASAWVLGAVGYSVTRPGGFLIVLPGGELGIEETCSGVTALTALTAFAAYFAFWKRSGVVRGLLLVAAAVPVVVGVNVLRVTLSGVVQEAAGAAYIRGGWHDALGFGTVLVGLGVVWLLSKCVTPKKPADATVAARPLPASPWFISIVLACSLSASVVVVWHGRTLVPPPVPTPPLGEVSPQLGEWVEVARPPVPPHVADLLQADAIVHREYRNPLGRSATVWVIYWTSAHAVRGYHHPDVCLPNVGYRETSRGVVTISPDGGGELPVTSRTLTGASGDLYVLYWTQTGRRVWGPADEAEAQAGLQLDHLLSRATASWTEPPPEPAGRLVVLIGSPHPTDFGRGEVEAFARAVADDVYRVCPSARGPFR